MSYDAWKTRSPDDDRPPDEYDEMTEEDEEMSSDACFVWCDIDGRGKKWRLAVSREMDDGEDGLYFPLTDIVERLRKRIDPDDPDLRVLDRDRIEAAQEIERLRAMVAYLEEQWQKLRELMDE